MQQGREYPTGFSEVAAFIAKDADSTTTIYRRFDRLSAKNLLYLQSRLQKLEALDYAIDNEDILNITKDAVKSSSSWEDLEKLALTDKRERKRLDLAKQIEETIKAYRELFEISFLIPIDLLSRQSLTVAKQSFGP